MRQRFLSLQRKLTQSVRDELHHLLGDESREVRSYYLKYKRSFQDYEQLISLPQLMADLSRFSLILVGDFHSCSTSQRGFLRILEKQRERSVDTFGVIMECLHTHNEKDVRQFLAGSITDSEFLDTIDWHSSWGFPWPYYRPIFQFCQKQQISIFSLRSPDTQSTPLKDQDRKFAETIKETILSHPEITKWFVLIGDLHLAPPHLPRALNSIWSDCPNDAIVYQNSERVYWKLASYNLENSVDVVRLEKGKYCLNSVAPWIKYQSYVQWLREHSTSEWDEDDLEEESFPQILDNDQVFETILTLKEFIGLPETPNLDHFSCYSSHNLTFLDRIKLNKRFTNEELKKIDLWITEKDSLFIPRENILYVGFPKPSRMKSLASIYLHAIYTDFDDIFLDVQRDFYRFILVEAIGFLGAKILNPRLKCNQPKDFVRMQECDESKLLTEKKQIPLGKERKVMISFILDHLNNCQRFLEGQDFQVKLPKLSIHNERPYYWIANQLGRLLGNSLYETLQRSEGALHILHQLWTTPLDSHDEGLEFYLQCLETIDNPIDFNRTKRAQL